MAIVGPAGIGKSAILNWYAARPDVTVVRATGAISEQNIPYAGLSQILGPLLDLLPVLPRPQFDAISACLALVAPAKAGVLPICMGTLNLLAASADSRPTLVLVDDCQWLDAESMSVFQFVQKRLVNDSIVMVTAFRTWTQDSPIKVPQIELAGLSPQAARQLLDGLDYNVTEEVSDWLIRVTAGNPLALRDLPAYLSSRDLSVRAWRNEPAPVGEVLRKAYGHAFSGLAGTEQQAALIAAVLDDVPVRILSRALGSAGMSLRDLESAEDAHLISIVDGRSRPRHPLIRSAMTSLAAPSSLRAARAAAAEGLAGSNRPLDGEARVWHLAESVADADELIAALLEEAAISATARAGFAAASATYAKAAQLSRDAGNRARRHLRAAEAAFTAGQGIASRQFLDRAREECPTDLDLEVEIEHLAGRIETWSGRPADAAKRLREHAILCLGRDPGRSIQLAVDATAAAALSGQMSMATENADLVSAIAANAGPAVGAVGDLLVGSVKAMRGDGNMALAHLDRARVAFDVPDPPAELVQPLSYLATSFQFIDRFGEAIAVFERAIAAARRHGAVGELPFALSHLASAQYRAGDWAAAYANATEALAIADESGRAVDRPVALVILAMIEAGRGQDRARSHAAEAIERARAMGAQFIVAQGYSAIGLLDLGVGKPASAVSSLQRCQQIAVELELMELGYLQWAAELVEALARSGNASEMAFPLRVMRSATHADTPEISQALLARCEGLASGDQEWESAFQAALSHHHRGETRPFELARTQLCYGERLRRGRRRKDARIHLTLAWEQFSGLGSTCWADRAARELRATGGTAPGPITHKVDLFTPQEYQVALAVTRGATNRQVAEELFLSQKTVEYHLSSIYRRLGLTSRAELATEMGTLPPSP